MSLIMVWGHPSLSAALLGPSWAPTQIYVSDPSWGPAQHQAESKLTNHRTVYSDQSQGSLFWPITRQFIL